jgi:hypothetical protein
MAVGVLPLVIPMSVDEEENITRLFVGESDIFGEPVRPHVFPSRSDDFKTCRVIQRAKIPIDRNLSKVVCGTSKILLERGPSTITLLDTDQVHCGQRLPIGMHS